MNKNFTLVVKKVDKLPKNIDPKCPLVEPDNIGEKS